MYDEDDGYYERKKCYSCEDIEESFKAARLATLNIVKQLYMNEALDLEKLEDDLDNLCGCLCIRHKLYPLTIKRNTAPLPLSHFSQPNYACDDLLDFSKSLLRAQGS